MTPPKFTPPPWQRVKQLGSRHWTLGRVRNHVAEPLPEENFDADWRLAEAAPELYEALEAAYAQAQKDGTWPVELALQVSAALDKARGNPARVLDTAIEALDRVRAKTEGG